MPGPEVPRPALEDALRERVRQGPPLLLAGPIGSGKTTLLRRLGAALAESGATPVYLDLMGAASSPERFAQAALDGLPAERFGGRLAQAAEVRRLASSGRANGAATVQALLSLWTSLATDGAGRPVVLLLDEATEIRSLAYYQGLRGVAELFAAALRRRAAGTLLATSFPSLARKHWDFEMRDLPPLGADDLRPWLGGDAARAVERLSWGWPVYASVLLEEALRGGSVASAWAREMAPGGRLELACRFAHESLLLRSRGYGMSKALLGAVAARQGVNLTTLYRQLGRSPGATRDYLGWLLAVDALKVVRKRYSYVDGLLAEWVRLHGRGRPPSHAELAEAARQRLAPDSEAPQPDAPVAAEASVTRARRTESLIEID